MDLVGYGPPGANALIVIADSPQALIAEVDADERKAKVKQFNRIWGKLAAETKIEP